MKLIDWLSGNPKDFQAPTYCKICGSLLEHDIDEHFDPHTGEKVKRTNPYHMHCTKAGCKGWASQGQYDHWHVG